MEISIIDGFYFAVGFVLGSFVTKAVIGIGFSISDVLVSKFKKKK